ncbi:UPF0175 family protein [Ammonifex thiophilus]|uniref:UPF0175 family protein n=1 Tax=Ammonifex thiophilus TaxID=444093 RepID=UPI001403A18D|nr:UPF0175 family protein [Ammonifex thiophilus]
MVRISVELPDEVLQLVGNEAGLRQRLAVALYAEGSLSMAEAAELAGMDYMDFWERVTSLGLGPRYTLEHYEEDVRTMEELGLLSSGGGDKP